MVTVSEVMALGDVVMSFSYVGGELCSSTLLKIGEDRYVRMPVRDCEVEFDGDGLRDDNQIRRLKVNAGFTQEQFDTLFEDDEEASRG